MNSHKINVVFGRVAGGRDPGQCVREDEMANRSSGSPPQTTILHLIRGGRGKLRSIMPRARPDAEAGIADISMRTPSGRG